MDLFARSSPPRLITAPHIARDLGLSSSELDAILRRHRIGPVCRVGRIRLYGSTQVQRIVASLSPPAMAQTS